MVGRYTTQKWRRSGTQNVHSIEEARTFRGRSLMTQAERAVGAPPKTKRRRFSKGHILNVVKYLPYIRRCRARCRVPRKVPKKVMETVFALALR